MDARVWKTGYKAKSVICGLLKQEILENQYMCIHCHSLIYIHIAVRHFGVDPPLYILFYFSVTGGGVVAELKGIC